MNHPSIHVWPDAEGVAHAAASAFLDRAGETVREKGMFTVCLSGGSTPRRLFSLLAERGRLAKDTAVWDNIHIFWGDERFVPPDHPESNFRTAHDVLLSRIAIPPANIHRIRTEEGSPAHVANLYEEELRSFFRLSPGARPCFDLVFLGMGPDGHTASLFPGHEVLDETRQLVVAPWVEKFGAHRISLTVPVFNQAACVTFLVTGEDKADVVARILGHDRNETYPASNVQPCPGKLEWFLDRAAALGLSDETDREVH